MYASVYTNIDTAGPVKLRVAYDPIEMRFWVHAAGVVLCLSDAEFHELEMQCRAAWSKAGETEAA